MIIKKTTVEYKRQIYYGKDVEVKCWIKRIGNSSLELYEEIWQQGSLCVFYVNYNVQESKSEIIPEEVKKELEKHMLIVLLDYV